MHQTLNNDQFNQMLLKVGKSYLPPEPKKKPKFTLKQLFYFKKKFKK